MSRALIRVTAQEWRTPAWIAASSALHHEEYAEDVADGLPAAQQEAIIAGLRDQLAAAEALLAKTKAEAAEQP